MQCPDHFDDCEMSADLTPDNMIQILIKPPSQRPAAILLTPSVAYALATRLHILLRHLHFRFTDN